MQGKVSLFHHGYIPMLLTLGFDGLLTLCYETSFTVINFHSLEQLCSVSSPFAPQEFLLFHPCILRAGIYPYLEPSIVFLTEL